MKATAIAPSNIAFIKYWGKKDEKLRLPENGSISMNLSNLTTTTTVEFDLKYKKDNVTIDDKSDEKEVNRVIKHLDRIRNLAKINLKAKVISKNNFPKSTGLSSSASGFAALTIAGVKAAGINLTEKELSILARLGSGSACRSIPDGFVEWLNGKNNETSYSISIYKHDYWDILDIVVIVSDEKKMLSTSEGHNLAKSSVFFPVRLSHIRDKIKVIKYLLKQKNFEKFGEFIEAEALELHAIMLTSHPSLIYWLSGTLHIMRFVKKCRSDGLSVYFTVNTGQDIHLIIKEKNKNALLNRLKNLLEVKNIIVNRPSQGGRLSDKHLF